MRASQAKQDLKHELAANSSRCSLALDGWTSRLNNSYMGMTLAAKMSPRRSIHYTSPLLSLTPLLLVIPTFSSLQNSTITSLRRITFENYTMLLQKVDSSL